MFLDDELYKMTFDFAKSGSSDIQGLNAQIYRMCANHFQSRIDHKMASAEQKAAVKRTFNLFDSFIKKLEKSGIFGLVLIAQVLKRNHFRDQLFKDKKFKEAYDKL